MRLQTGTVSRFGLAAMLLVIVGTLGCGSRRLPIAPAPRSFTADDYERIYLDWTRSSDEFSFGRLTDVLHVTATFESWEFRWAYVTRYSGDYSLRTEERTRLLRSSLADAQQRHRFFITILGSRYRESDLTNERSAWRVMLVDENGRQTRPAEIERVRRTGAAERIYFPSVSVQRQTLRVAFPTQHPDGTPVISPQADSVLLRFTGAEGRVDLVWELEQGSPRESDEVETALPALPATAAEEQVR